MTPAIKDKIEREAKAAYGCSMDEREAYFYIVAATKWAAHALKLREALEKVEHGQQNAFSGDDTYEAWQKCRKIARTALAQFDKEVSE